MGRKRRSDIWRSSSVQFLFFSADFSPASVQFSGWKKPNQRTTENIIMLKQKRKKQTTTTLERTVEVDRAEGRAGEGGCSQGGWRSRQAATGRSIPAKRTVSDRWALRSSERSGATTTNLPSRHLLKKGFVVSRSKTRGKVGKVVTQQQRRRNASFCHS